MKKSEIIILLGVMVFMAIYFLVAKPVMMDDGFYYEGFTETLAHGHVDFKSFYGFQGLSILSVPIYWLTGSHYSIIITSIIFSLLSVFLAYLIGRDFYKSKKAGFYMLSLFLLIPYPYVTMMRGFQEAALLFFILLIIYGSISERLWTPLAWAMGSLVKPFALVLAPMFASFKPFKSNFKKYLLILAISFIIGITYLGLNYYQTGHLINDAVLNSYQPGTYNNGQPPPLKESFTLNIKGYLRIVANLLVASRKILISPFVILLGSVSLIFSKGLRLRKRIMISVALNILLVGSLLGSWPKYLLPMITLISLAAIPALMRYRWLVFLVLIDSLTVFIPIFNYFGRVFWPNLWIFLLPFYLASIILIFDFFFPSAKLSDIRQGHQ